MDYQRRVLPFYLSYSTPYFMKEEDSVLRDLEYLQEMYPKQAKDLQKRIAAVIDKLDYEGSMLYDEYPDKWQLYRLTDTVVGMLQREEDEKEAPEQITEEKWEWIKDMVQLVLYYEIYKRRHGGRRGFLKF